MDKMDEDNLEYNDGLGDMLRQKDRLEFSWIKTIVSLFIIFVVVFIILYALFTFGKKAMSGPEIKYAAAPTEQPLPEEVVSANELESLDDSTPEFDDLVTLDPQATETPAPVPVPVKPAPVSAPKPVKVAPAPTPKPVKITPAPAPKPSESRLKPVQPIAQKPMVTKRSGSVSQPANAQPVVIQSVTATPPKSTHSEPKRIRIQHTIAPKSTSAPKPVVSQQAAPLVGPEPIADLPEPTSFKVIVGSFQNKVYATDLVSKLQSAGVSAYLFQDSAGNFKVQSGSFKTRDEAKSHQDILKKKGFSDTFLLAR